MDKEKKPSWPWTCYETTQRKLRGLLHCHQKIHAGWEAPFSRMSSGLWTAGHQWDRLGWPRLNDSNNEWSAVLWDPGRTYGTTFICHLRQLDCSVSFYLLSLTIMIIAITIPHTELSLHSRHWVNFFVDIFPLNPHIIISLLNRKELSKVIQLVRRRADI